MNDRPSTSDGGHGDPPERRPGWILPIVLVVLVVLAGALAWVLLSGDDDGADDAAGCATLHSHACT